MRSHCFSCQGETGPISKPLKTTSPTHNGPPLILGGNLGCRLETAHETHLRAHGCSALMAAWRPEPSVAAPGGRCVTPSKANQTWRRMPVWLQNDPSRKSRAAADSLRCDQRSLPLASNIYLEPTSSVAIHP